MKTIKDRDPEAIKLLKNIHDTIKWRVNGCANGMLSDSKSFMTWDEILRDIENHVSRRSR